MGAVSGLIDCVVREALLFASVGILLGGVDDLAVDCVFLVRGGWRRLARRAGRCLDDLPAPETPGAFVIFVPAWDEAAVIAPMLRSTLARVEHPAFQIWVGCYPNDPATIAAVETVAAEDTRVRLVIGARAGPTTKADCLNTLWRALAASGERPRAVVLHDAEDVIHPAELRVFDALLGRCDVVQIPVLPLIEPRHRLISGVVADEFAESHAKTLVVRELVGAGLPLAGVGCAILLPMLEAVAARHGAPFDAGSLCEDYELGLRIAALGGTGTLARVAEARGGGVVAVREYFPHRLDTAVRQKARWMVGIALAGWDRTGWARPLALGDHWMRAKDRSAPLAMLVLAAAYLAALAWPVSMAAHWVAASRPAPLPSGVAVLLRVNGGLLIWRMLVRAVFTGRAYGWREAAWSAPRMVVGNLIALLSARRALIRYLGMLRGDPLRWDKTAHAFPAELGGAGQL